jgi:dTMP kinase
MKIPNGFLLAIEGIDGAGKSTQAKAVAETLRSQGFEVITTREPTNGPWGRILRDSATQGRRSPEEELDLFLKDRREHVETLINPALREGKIVITDRYYFSTAAYQGARGLDPGEIIRQNEAFAPQPNLLVILEMDPAAGISRVEQRSKADFFETKSGLAGARKIFSELRKPYLVRIDARQEPGEISSQILQEVSTRLNVSLR